MDKIRVTLPPWQRGDGQLCKNPGEYRCRWLGQQDQFHIIVGPNNFMFVDREYSGPIEFIIPEPEPEPLTLEGCVVRVDEVAPAKTWMVRQVYKVIGMPCNKQIVTAATRRLAVEANNAAVRMLQGAKE